MASLTGKLSRQPYTIGKGKPPTETRWKPGQSGNPKGRPKDLANTKTIFKTVLSQKIALKENGKIRKIAGVEAIVRALFARAIRGDLKTARELLSIAEELNTQSYTKNVDKMSAKEVHETYLRMIRASKPPYSG
jgi:hypothetical protein